MHEFIYPSHYPEMAKRIQSTTWGFPSDITTSSASVAAAITNPANPQPEPSSMILLCLKKTEKITIKRKKDQTESTAYK